jgi:hypothetical protein
MKARGGGRRVAGLPFFPRGFSECGSLSSRSTLSPLVSPLLLSLSHVAGLTAPLYPHLLRSTRLANLLLECR